MKLLLLTLLIFSCGKKKSENSTNREKFPLQKEYLDLLDIDGDKLENHKDLQPFIANLPKSHFNFKLWIGNKSTELRFHKNQQWESVLLKYLTKSYKKKDLSLEKITAPLKLSNKISIPSHFAFVNLEIFNSKNAKNLEVALSKDDILHAHFTLPNQEQKLSQFSRELLHNQHLAPELLNFETERGQYKELRDNIKKNTYELILVQDQGIFRYYIASKTSILDALKELRDLSEDDFQKKRDQFLENDLTFLPHDFRATFLFNVPAQNLTYRPEKGEQIIVYSTPIQRLQKAHQKVKRIRVKIKPDRFKVNLGEFSSFKTKISEDILVPIQKNIKKGCHVKFPLGGKVYATYYEHSVSYQKKKFREAFQVELSGKKVSSKKLEVPYSSRFWNREGIMSFNTTLKPKKLKVGKSKGVPKKESGISYKPRCSKKHRFEVKEFSPKVKGYIDFEIIRPLR